MFILFLFVLWICICVRVLCVLMIVCCDCGWCMWAGGLSVPVVVCRVVVCGVWSVRILLPHCLCILSLQVSVSRCIFVVANGVRLCVGERGWYAGCRRM